MPTTKKGQKEVRIVLDEGSETHTTLLEWAGRRGLTIGKAARVIMTDWAEAVNGRTNPFAIAIAASAGITVGSGLGASPPVSAQEPEMSAEEKARQEALLQAAEQFL